VHHQFGITRQFATITTSTTMHVRENEGMQEYSIKGQEQFGEQLRQELTIYLGQD
jgi:hypothetical protein